MPHCVPHERCIKEFGECKVNSEMAKLFVELLVKRRRHMSGQVSQQIAEQLLQLNHLLNGINKAVGPLPPFPSFLARLTY